MPSSYTTLNEQVSQITGLIEHGIFLFVILILTLIMVRVIWTGKHQKKAKKVLPTPMKTCPDCAEQVQMAARICRFCRHDFSVWPANVVPPLGPTGGSPTSPYGGPVGNQTAAQNPGPK